MSPGEDLLGDEPEEITKGKLNSKEKEA